MEMKTSFNTTVNDAYMFCLQRTKDKTGPGISLIGKEKIMDEQEYVLACKELIRHVQSLLTCLTCSQASELGMAPSLHYEYYEIMQNMIILRKRIETCFVNRQLWNCAPMTRSWYEIWYLLLDVVFCSEDRFVLPLPACLMTEVKMENGKCQRTTTTQAFWLARSCSN